MKGLLALLLACLALGVVTAGCGGDDDDDGGGGNGGGAAETQQEEPAAEDGGGGGGGGGAEVSMESIKFEPATVTISAGDTVTWVNNDTVDHDVTGDDFKSGDAGGMANGDTFEHTFPDPGTFDYVCTVHPGMEGTVEVE